MKARRVFIVDDEEIARGRIRRFASEFDRSFEIKEAANGLEALSALPDFRPDIVFLDIQMPGLDGFDVLAQVENRDFQIIFQTAYDEYALKAFDENAIDYLLKPFTQERFNKALEKALRAAQPAAKLERLEASRRGDKRFLDRLTYKHAGKIKMIECSEVHAFVSQDHCTTAYTGKSEHIIDLSIAHLSERLDPEKFIRCSRAGLAAIDQIKQVGGSEDSHVELKSGRRLELSRSCRKIVLGLFKA